MFTVSYTVDRLNGTGTTPVARTVTVRQPFNPPAEDTTPTLAVLEGFMVNGQPLAGFKPSVTAYTITAKQGEKVTVTPPPAEDTTPTLAVLEGFMVNGQPLAGFKPSVTAYTITAKQGEKVTVTPVAGTGVKVVAGASRQTAYTTVQTWQVTGPAGSTRTYTVTLVREHTDKTADERFEPPTPTGQVSDKANPSETTGVKVVAGASRQTAYTTVQTWQVTGPDGSTRTYTVTLVREHTDKTADERFEPPTPTGQVSDKDNPSETNTQLVSYGYTLDGEYHPQESATFTIPEHGVLAWRSYAGQVVQPTGTRMHGMTWQYDLDVLAADHTTYGRITLTVTYLTHDTHRAGLTGIKLDGHPIDGFTPDRLEYTVPVDNPDRYVLDGANLAGHRPGRLHPHLHRHPGA